jgi:mRNA interferase HigB
MHILSWSKVREFIEIHPESLGSLRTWFDSLGGREFTTFHDLRCMFPSVDRVCLKSGKERYIFNVGGNTYRVICSIHFNRAKVYVRFVLTHKEYDQEAWKNE